MTTKKTRENNSDGYVSVREKMNYLKIPEVAKKLKQEYLKSQSAHLEPSDIWEMFDYVNYFTGPHNPPKKNIELQEPYSRPYHLKPFVEKLNESLTQDIRVCLASPARHGKTLTCMMSLLFLSLARKHQNNVYVTYNQTRAEEVMNTFCRLLEELGIDHRKNTRTGMVFITPFHTERRDNTVMFTSVNGSLTGYDVNGLVILDDLIKGPMEASSPTTKKRIWDFYTQNVLSRKMAKFSVVSIGTRWVTDDLTGRLIQTGDFEYIRLPAFCDDPVNDPLGRDEGDPLWEEYHDTDSLLEQQKEMGKIVFECMMQGNPGQSEQRMFNDPTHYQELRMPGEPIVTYGIDLGYTGYRDFSVIVKLKTWKEWKKVKVEKVLRRQTNVYNFIDEMREFVDEPGRIHFHSSGPEKHWAETVKNYFNSMVIHQASESKSTRAALCADAWNNGMLQVPMFSSDQDKHMGDFVQNVCLFNGIDHDGSDDVDALASAFKPVEYVLYKKNKHYPENKRQRNKEKRRLRHRQDPFAD